ncbi:MAG: cysteine hydrolase [Acidobacteriota bacterium]|nr:cysteine hydrolase [Acidobacteriota bacterium]
MAQELPPIEPEHTVLLILDAQPSTSGNVPDRDAIIANLADAIAAARANGVRVAYVRAAFDDDEYAQVKPTNKLLGPLAGMAAHRPLHKDDPSTAVLSELAPKDGEIIVRKNRIGAFSTGDLGDQLDPLGIDTVILGGFSTSGVVLSTLREAIDHDARVFVLSDGTGDPLADVHQVLTEKVFPTHAWVVTTAELVGLLG